MKIELQENEKIIKEGAANHFQGLESVGGKLYLTNRRVVFNSHNLNIQIHQISIPFNKIKKVEKRMSLGIVPNGLLIKTIDGKEEKFVVWGRSKWRTLIEQKVANELH